MLWFDGESWKVYKRKVTYKAPYEFYTDEVDLDIGKDWIDVNIETIDLNLEQLKRLEQVRYFDNVGIDDLEKYIFDGEMPTDDFVFLEKVIQKQTEDDKIQMIKELTDIQSLSVEELEEFYFLKKDFKHGIFIEKNDLVEYQGGLYVALIDHVAMDIYPPDTTPTLYRVKRKGEAGEQGEPDPWEQPTHAENAYKIGDRVLYLPDGLIYVSQIDGNDTEPTKDEPYNRWWKLEED